MTRKPRLELTWIGVEAIRVLSAFEAAQKQKKEAIQQIKDESQREKESICNEAELLIFAVVPSLNRTVSSIQEIKRPENRKVLMEKAAALIDSRPEPELPAMRRSRLMAVEECLDETIETIILKTIEIPRIVIHPSTDARSCFEEFDLDTSGFRYAAVEDEIVQKSLVDSSVSLLRMDDADGRARFNMKPEELLVNELLSFGEVDYDRDATLLHRLAASAYEKIASELLLEKDRFGALLYNKRDIAAKIYTQMMAHFRTKEDGFEAAEACRLNGSNRTLTRPRRESCIGFVTV